MKRFTRLSVRFPKKLENLEAACAAFLAFYVLLADTGCYRGREPAASRDGCGCDEHPDDL
ncbi:MAG: hypothetical protein ABSG86_03480 [Thermoguttaceae bacterium]|jgi:hypothetical protein